MIFQNIIGLILIVFSTIVLWFSTKFGFGSFPAFLGEVTADALIFTLIFSLIFRMTQLRKKIKVFLIFGIVWFGSIGLISFELYKNGIKERELAHSSVEIIDSLLNNKEQPQNTDLSNSEPLILWLKNYVSRIQLLQLEFDNEVNAAKLGNMLAPENLANIKTAKQSLAKIINLEQFISNYELKILAELDHSGEMLSKIKDGASQAAYEGFLKTKNHGIQLVKQSVEIKKNIIHTIGNILNLSIRMNGKFYIQDSQLLFEDQETLNLYNKYIIQLSSLSKQEEQIHTERRNRIENQKNKMNDVL